MRTIPTYAVAVLLLSGCTMPWTSDGAEPSLLEELAANTYYFVVDAAFQGNRQELTVELAHNTTHPDNVSILWSFTTFNEPIEDLVQPHAIDAVLRGVQEHPETLSRLPKGFSASMRVHESTPTVVFYVHGRSIQHGESALVLLGDAREPHAWWRATRGNDTWTMNQTGAWRLDSNEQGGVTAIALLVNASGGTP